MFRSNAFRVGLALTIVASGLWTVPAHAATAGLQYVRTEGQADFGVGHHSWGNPDHGATIFWDYRVMNGVVVPTARVAGTLYLDRSSSGCARLIVSFEDYYANVLHTQTVYVCGPGSNANDVRNQAPVDISFPAPNSADARVRRVFLEAGAGPSITQLGPFDGCRSYAPPLMGEIKINNGTADFGGANHTLGSPDTPASVRLYLMPDGVISARVYGILYWDSLFSAGCSRVVLQFQDRNGLILRTRTFNKCGTGGVAGLDANRKLLWPRTFSSASLWMVTATVGTVVDGRFVGDVKSASTSFGSGNVIDAWNY